MRVYCIYDDISDCLVNVFCSINDDTAERSFFMLLTGQDDNLFTRFPHQFSVRYVGDILSRDQVGELPTTDHFGEACLVYPALSDGSYHLHELPVIRRGSEYGNSYLENERRCSHLNTSEFVNNEEVSEDE